MSTYSLLAEFSRWLYFIVCILSVMNSFIHLHIQFEMSECSEVSDTICIGRNIAWRKEDNFDLDTNKLFWRQTFSLSPDIFFDIWSPIIVSLIALLQHFDTFKCDIISSDWPRTLLFIIGSQLFTVLGYGSNFGVVVAFIGFAVALLYFIICILLYIGVADTEIRDKTVLNINEYIMICINAAQYIKSAKRDINHDNDEQYPLSPIDDNNNNNNTDDILKRLSITQPGSNMNNDGANTLGLRNVNYSEIVQCDVDSNEDLSLDEELKHNENDNVLKPPPPPALPYNTAGTQYVETRNESDVENDDINPGGVYQQPCTHVTQQ